MSEYFDIQKELNKNGFPLTDRLIANMEFICYNLGDRARRFLGKVVNVTSGYRSPEYNKQVGGSKTSRHILGLAKDITWKGICTKIVKSVARHLRDNVTECEYQFIWYPAKKFVHLGLAKPGKNTEFLVYRNGKYSLFNIG